MAEREGFEGERRASSATTASTTPSFSQLLFGDDHDDDVVKGLDYGQSFTYTPVFPVSDNRKPPKMLCFGGAQSDGEHEMLLFGGKVIATPNITPQRSGVTCSDSSSASSGNNSIATAANAISKSNKKRKGGQESAQCTSNAGAAAAAAMNQRTASKKSKSENSKSTGTAKRKERLGERITALQQLVSPFGKTDTASVLHEAMGYIRFLQDQVQVLCSPYLHHLRPEGGENGGEELRQDLRSRGLCLVPVACTVHVESSNGADFWSPAMGTHVTQQ